jgi:hypothetical protein
VLDRPRVIDAEGNPRGRTANSLLLVRLELKTSRPEESARFRGWSSYAKEISLTDEHGVRYDVRTRENLRGLFVDGQCQEMVFLSADVPTTDVIVFAWPEETAPGLPSASDEELLLQLPKGAYGEQGELKYRISLSTIDVTEEALGQYQGAPSDVGGDEDGPIRIPGLTD